jgi:transposase
MRKQINSLAVMVQDEMGLDLFEGNLFLFCNKRRNRLKILYWDKNGFCLLLKRLEKEKLPWPKDKREAVEITEGQLRMILSGIDFWKAHKELKYSEIT